MAKKPRKKPQTTLGKIWHFLWYEDSFASWIVNVIVIFLLIKFILYPGVGLIMGTQLPVVAVVSESMDHDYTKEKCSNTYDLCGQERTQKQKTDFDDFWNLCGDWYEDQGITKATFETFPLKKGFSKGDIIALRGKTPEKVDVGDVIVFASGKPYPIIHRVVEIQQTPQGYLFATKGDHNPSQITDAALNELAVQEEQLLGVAQARVPYLGWVKIALVELFDKDNC